VDVEKCIGCGSCYSVCPQGVFVIRKGKSYAVHEERCVMCRACITHCPVDAISISVREKEYRISRLYEG